MKDLSARWLFTICLLALALTCNAQPAVRWWKGNLHTHTLWSDGDDFPEMVVDWYKSRGYDFLAISDHNVLHQENLLVMATNPLVKRALPRYLRRFGSNWVEHTSHEGQPAIRLKTLQEYRSLFEAPNRFLLLQAEEVTDRFGRWPVHLIATGIEELIPPQHGDSVVETIQRNIDALHAQRRRTRTPMMIHLAHPNFGWAVTAEDMIQLRGDRFFEVYNGHPHVHNEGDAIHASTERMWDIVNTHRIAGRRGAPLLGLAVDDSHHYFDSTPMKANSGRGWVMVRAKELTATALISALEAGDFYASSGVTLRDVTFKDNKLTVRVEPQTGIAYSIQFIGTRRPVDWRSQPVAGTNGYLLTVTRSYSSAMGAVLSEHRATTATYTCTGDELFVRAKVISTKVVQNPVAAGEKETAWTQPVEPRR
jgi:hypothetical protein